MNICFIYYNYPLYPRGSYFHEFLNKLAESVDKIYLIASQYPKGDFENAENIKILWVPLRKIKYLDEIFFMFACLFRAMFTRELAEIDLVNTVGPRGLLAGWYLKKRYKIPLVCTIEMLNEKGSLFNNLYYRFVKFLMTRIPIDRFICWSNYYRDNHLKRWEIGDERIEIIPCGIDTERHNPGVDGSEIKNKYSPSLPLIVFAKPLYRENTESAKILVRSIKLLQPKRRVKLLIGGGEGKVEVEGLARELGVSDLVDFMPTTDFTDIPRYIAASDLVVLPFIYAPTTSRSLLEAMAMGKPIITVPIGEIKEILKDGENAVLVERAPDKIAWAIERILEDDGLMKYLGANALKTVREGFSLSIIVEKEVSLFKVIISEKNN